MNKIGNKADCPGCGRANESRADGLFYCEVCQSLYDDDPDEGGTYSGRNPVQNVINREEFELREKERQRRRQSRHTRRN